MDVVYLLLQMEKIRQNIVEKLANIGFEIDFDKNSDREQLFINSEKSYKITVVPTNEELMVAKDTLKLI